MAGAGVNELLVAADGSPPSRLAIGFARAVPVLVVAGTTTDFEQGITTRLLPLLKIAVDEIAARRGAIVTGGTDAGIFHVLRMAIDSSSSSPMTVGVAPDGMVIPITDASSARSDQARIDAGLDVLVRVIGDRWGDETAMLSRVAGEIADDEPVVVLLVGGGAIAFDEVKEHLRQRRSIIVVKGSGRLADVLAAPLDDSDEDLRALVEGGDVTSVAMDEPASVANAIRSALRRNSRSWRDVRGSMARHSAARRQRWTALSVFPQLPFEPAAPAPLAPGAALRFPQLASRLHEANAVVLPAFAECETEALVEQNRFRWFAVLAIFGGLCTTVAGAVQAWLQSAQWPGVLVATLGAATTALSTVARRQGAREQYVTARRRAEHLRSLYYQHLVTPPSSTEADPAHDELESRVARIRYGSKLP